MGFLFNHEEDLKKRDEEQVRQVRRGTEPNVSGLDVAKGIKSSVYELGAMGNAGIRAVTGSPRAAYRERRDQLRAEKVTETMSPGGRAMAQGSFLPDEEGNSAFLRNPIGYVAFNGAKQVPMLAISAIPGAAIGRGIATAAKLAKYAAPATTGTTAVMGGVLNTGDVLHSVFTELDNMTKKDWSKVPAYIKLVQKGMSYEDASAQLKDDIVANSGAVAFALGTVLNTFGLGQQLAKTGAGVGVKEGFVKGLAKGAGKEFVQEFAEEGSGNIIVQNASKFTDDFNWVQALDAALAGGTVGGVIGGGVGGATNIRRKPPVIPQVAPGNAPSASQAAAVQGAPLPPVLPPKTPSAATSVSKTTPPGPPVVAPGGHTPPPGSTTKGKSFAKKPKAKVATPVVVAAVPDASQKAALDATINTQPPPQVAPPPAGPNVPVVPPAAPAIVRKRAQAEIAPPPVQVAPPPAVVPPPQVIEQPAPVVIPPISPNPNIPPAPVEQLPPGSMGLRLPGMQPRVLPDIQAQQRREAELDAAAAETDKSARGIRYDLGQNAEEVNNPPKHQAWRRLMQREVEGPNASPIAKEAVSLFGKRGVSLPAESKERLKELHAQWINEKPVAEATVVEKKPPKGQRKGMAVGNVLAKVPEEFIKAVAEEQNSIASGDDTAAIEQRARNAMEILQGAPDRPEMMEAINYSDYVRTAVNLINNIENGYVGTSESYSKFQAAEKALLKPKDEVYTPEIKAEMDRKTESMEKKSLGGFDAVVAETSGVKESVPVSGTFGAASEVRKVEVSAEEKAAIAAKYNTKPKTKEEVAAATPKAAQPEIVTQRVTPTVKTQTEVKKEVKVKKAVVVKQEKRKEAMALAGQDLLDLRRKQQAAVRSGDPQAEELLQVISAYRVGVKKTFGQAALDKLNSDVEKLLANEKFPADKISLMSSRIDDPFEGSMISDMRGRLITVYHGGPVGIQTFKPNRELNGVGIYFSKDKSLAREYARIHEKVKGGESTVYEAQLNIKNPLVIKGKTFWQRLFDKVTFKTSKQLSRERQEGFRQSGHLYPEDVAKLQAQGYDGIVNEIAEEIVVFESSQIRLLANESVRAMPARRVHTYEDIIGWKPGDESPVGEQYMDSNGSLVPIDKTITVNEALTDSGQASLHDDMHYLFGVGGGGPTRIVGQGALKLMYPRIKTLAGDVKVHIIDDGTGVFERKNGISADGIHNSRSNVIVVRKSLYDARHTDPWFFQVILHEAAHAAFVNSIRTNQRAMDSVELLFEYVRLQVTDKYLKEVGAYYGMTDYDEFIAEAWSNPRFQVFLASLEIPAEMARKLGLGPFKKYSVWSSFLEIARKALGIPKGYHSALEAIIASTNRIVADQLPTDKESYFNNLKAEWDIPNDPITRALPTRPLQGKILQAAKEKSSNSFFRNLQLNLTTLHQLAQMADKVFPKGMAMKVSDIIGSIAVRRQELMTGASAEVVTLSHEMSEKYKGPVFEKYVDLAHQATSAAVNIAVPLTHPDNIHIKKGFQHSNSRAVHKELHGEWNSLPAELKDLWVKEVNFFRDAQDTLSLHTLNNVIELALSRKDKALAQRIHDGFMTEADRDLFRTNETMRMIAEAKELKKIKGYYTPKMRRGDYVLSGKYIMPAQYEPNRLKDTDKYVFDTRKEAEAFQAVIRKLGLSPRGSKVYSVDATTGKKHYTYTDPATGVEVKGPDGLPKLYRFSRGDTGSKQVYEVDVQTQMMEMFDNKAKGIAAEEQYRKDGKFEMKGLQLKEEFATNSKVISTSQMIRLKKSIAAREGYQKMNKAEQKLLTQAMNELSLSWMASTNINNRAKPRRNVLGASREHARNVAEYRATSASAIAQAEKQPELASAITDLENYATDNEGQTNTMTLPRSEILTQLRKAVENQEFKKPTKWNSAIQFLLRITFLKFLASPAYVMINMTQPFMLSLPTIGGRHGVVRTSMALTKAYNDIGFLRIMGAGLRDTAKGARDLVSGMTSESADYIGDLHKRLATQADGKELTDMLDYLYDIGIINRDAGIEIAELITKPGVTQHVIRSVEHIARQTSVAAEVINRTATAVAAFRLERAKGASYEQAKAYTQKTVANTQGIYSYQNAPAWFKHPVAAIPLQFRKYSQLYYSLLANMVHQTFKGATRAEKIEAGKQLGLMIATHVAMAGALGLPTEPLKAAFALMGFIGIPVPDWDEIEQKATELSMDMFGETFGDALVHGLPRLAGIDIHSRVGANSMLLFGTPEEATEDEWYAWAGKTALGAPGGTLSDVFKAKAAAEDGDWFKAAQLFVPIKVVGDAIKGAQSYTVGKTNARGKQTQEPSGLGSAALQAFGLKPAWIARQQEATSAYYAESRKRDAVRQDLIDTWKNSSGAGRRDAQKLITKFNKTVPKEARITGATLARSLRADKNYSKHGIYPGRRNKDLLEHFLGD